MEENNEGEGSFDENIDVLMPDISMNVDDVPIPFIGNEDALIPEQNGDVVEINGEDKGELEPEAPIDEVIDTDNGQNSNQIPEPYTAEEMPIQQHMFEKGTAVQYLKIHCTACNVHLGSAPNNQHKRYIHPLLNVIICKSCFTFYGSGDFDKDEDGSELYCRWCGQGGKVICCSKCPYVFCQRCIRTNLGKKHLEAVKESDDWICLVCNPKQIAKVRIICRALYEYIQIEIGLAEELNEPQRLTDDKSMCCRNRIHSPFKRKLSTPNEFSFHNGTNYDDSTSKKKKIKSNILSHMLGVKEKKIKTDDLLDQTWVNQVKDEVVCTPDLSMLIDDEESPTSDPLLADPLMPDSLVTYPMLANGNDADVQYVGQEKLPNIPRKIYWPLSSPRNFGYTVPSKPPIVLNTTTTTPLTTNSKKFNPTLIKLQKFPAVFNMQPTNTAQNIVGISSDNNASVIRSTVPIKLASGLKHDWLDKAIHFTAKVNQNLNVRLNNLTKEQANTSSLQNLITVHNSLQEILCNSINSLMEIRKNLHVDLINGLKKLNYHKVRNKTVHIQNTDDNDVIIIDAPSTTDKTDDILVSNTNLPPLYNYKKAGTSTLSSSAIITIPDDNVSETQTEEEQSSIETILNTTDITNTNEEIESNDLNIEKEIETIPENSPPETAVSIDGTLLESNFETVVDENLKYASQVVPEEELKQMVSVKVILEKDYGGSTLKTLPYKNYRAINTISCPEKHLKENAVALETDLVALDESEQQQVNGVIVDEDVLVRNTCNLSEELSQDPQTKDSGIDVDADQNLIDDVENV